MSSKDTICIAMHILIAEDDRNTCEMYRITLKSRGHRVVTTEDGNECLRVYNEHLAKSPESDPFDALVLDLKMPFLGGLEVMTRVLQLRPSQRIIISSSQVKDTLCDVVKNTQRIVEIMQKPFEPRELAETIESPSKSKHLRTINSPPSLQDIKNKSISDDGIRKGLENMGPALGPKVSSLVIKEFHDRGFLSDAKAMHSAKELLSALDVVFGSSNGVFFMQFFVEFLSPS